MTSAVSHHLHCTGWTHVLLRFGLFSDRYHRESREKQGKCTVINQIIKIVFFIAAALILWIIFKFIYFFKTLFMVHKINFYIYFNSFGHFLVTLLLLFTYIILSPQIVKQDYLDSIHQGVVPSALHNENTSRYTLTTTTICWLSQDFSSTSGHQSICPVLLYITLHYIT